MTRWIIAAALVIGTLAGCGPETQTQAKVETTQRWNFARAQVLCAIGAEQLKVGQLEQARLKTQEALALDPTYAEARIVLGKVYIEQGQFGFAITELSKAVELAPKSAEAVYLLAVAMEKDEKPEAALAGYRKTFEMDGSNILAVTAACEVLVTLGRAGEAREYLTSHMDIAGSEPGAHELFGRLAAIDGDWEQAARSYQQAHDLDFGNFRYREELAKAQYMSGKHPEAAETLKDLLGQGDYKAPSWVLTLLGDCHMQAGRFHAAVECYRKGCELAADSPNAWLNLAKANLACDDAPAAVAAAEKAFRAGGDSPEASLVLGYALLRDGQVKRATDVVSGAAARYPADATVQCLLGRIYAAAGDKAEATRCYAAAIKADPDCALARELLGGTDGR